MSFGEGSGRLTSSANTPTKPAGRITRDERAGTNVGRILDVRGPSQHGTEERASSGSAMKETDAVDYRIR